MTESPKCSNAENDRLEAVLAAALAEVGPSLPGALFRYLLRPDGSEALWYMSPGSLELFELTPEQAEADVGAIWATVNPACLAALQASIAESVAKLTPWRHEWQMRTPSGVQKWVQGNGKPAPWPDGGVVWTSLIVDITEQRDARRRVDVSEARLRSLLEHIEAIAVQGYDHERRVFLWNAASEKLYGHTAEEAIGRRLEDLIIPAPMRDAVVHGINSWIAGGPAIPSEELTLHDRAGTAVRVFSSHALLENVDGQMELFCIDIDMGEQHRALEALRRSEDRLSQVLAITGEGVWDWNLRTNVVSHNARWAEIVGLSPEVLDLDMVSFQKHLHPADHDRVMHSVSACLTRGGSDYAAEYRMLRADGREIWVEDRGRVVERDGAGRALRMLGSITDATARRQAEQQAQHLAYFDSLTALPNRQLLEERLERSMAVCTATNRYGALVMLDLDNFRSINDAHGHATGDRLLQAAGQRLGAQLSGANTLARPGGDEFLVLLTDLGDDLESAQRDATACVQHLRHALDEPIELDGIRFSAAACFGVSLYPCHGSTAEDLLREADTALYRAKAAGSGQIDFYSASMGGEVSARVQLDMDLEQAVEREEFELFIQPEVDAQGRIAGAELLLRWQHPTRGLLAPAAFIDAAERSGRIVSMGDWVLREGFRAAARLAAAGQTLPLSINVSPTQFRQVDFVDRVRAHLASTGASPDQIILEITENLLIDDVEQAARRMRELAALGLRFSIDDFGTGFSSLAYLKRLPLYQLKIDRSFIQDTPDDANDCAIVKLVISMAASLGLSVVAEGVETREQAAFLRGTGCELQQGYLYARPAPLGAWLQSHLDEANARR